MKLLKIKAWINWLLFCCDVIFVEKYILDCLNEIQGHTGHPLDDIKVKKRQLVQLILDIFWFRY